jgi:hypothetical protein
VGNFVPNGQTFKIIQQLEQVAKEGDMDQAQAVFKILEGEVQSLQACLMAIVKNVPAIP